jgi:short subunit dehydrogenase-like uncharacterized protein
MNSTDREFDVIVWGATGFTGQLVAEYLLGEYGVDISVNWAIAGRDTDKLAELKTSLGAEAEELQTIVADSFDEQKLDAMVSQSKVIISTVGPYAKYGSSLVAACVRAGTHYCDLAGEAQWIRQMIDEHHDDAMQSGARIVNCCGFDSVPMDIGVWFLQREANKRLGQYCESITMLVKATKGGASGGTIASMMNLIRESRKDRSIARVVADPYGLNPADERSGPDGRDQQNVLKDATTGSWTAPFIMAGINTKVVRRSHALQDYPYGREFRYHEAMLTGPGFGGWMKANMIMLGLGALITFASFDFTRGLLERFVLPKPGEGPDKDARENGFFDLRQFGRLADGTILKTRITGDRDPGYGSTSKMLSECAICLAQDELDSGGGVLTPASAMGEPLLRRLEENAGLSFELLD